MPAQRFHLSINVSDLAASVAFYGKLLGHAPAKYYPDYAKFEADDPGLVLALEPAQKAGLNHVGIRFENQEALMAAARRAAEAGLEAQYLQGVECCYSRQSKACFLDPDGQLVELYILEADLDHAQPKKPEAAAASAAPLETKSLDHLLGTPVPDFAKVADGSLDIINLRGTFNAPMPASAMESLLAECRRTLKPGGTIATHLLVADRDVAGKLPKLPGPASNVEVTPVATSILRAFEEAGFVGMQAKRYSHAPVFQFGGAEMRELLLQGQKKPDRSLDDGRLQAVIYKGPYKQVVDDEGEVYRRGEPKSVSLRQVEMLKQAQLTDQFVFAVPGSDVSCVTPGQR